MLGEVARALGEREKKIRPMRETGYGEKFGGKYEEEEKREYSVGKQGDGGRCEEARYIQGKVLRRWVRGRRFRGSVVTEKHRGKVS